MQLLNNIHQATGSKENRIRKVSTRLLVPALLVANFFISFRETFDTLAATPTRNVKISDFHNRGQGFINDGQICSSLTSSMAYTWKELAPNILKASYWPKEYSSNTNFTDWIDNLFLNYYGFQQLRCSSLHSSDPAATNQLLKIMSKRLAYLNNKTRIYHRPLHILVTGGSVTYGNNCGANPVGIPVPGWMTAYTSCTWPARLENLFNEGLFNSKAVVKVTNIAMGGASTEIGKIALEYLLFPDEVKKEPPHVVIWAHAPNDSQESDMNAVFYQHLPGYVNAARNIDICNDDLPMVVILEDFYGFGSYGPVNELSGYLSQLSSWYGLMSVNHANVIKHELWANFDNGAMVSHILGSDYNLHAGMGSHAGVAWTMLFNFLSAFTDSCAAISFGVSIPVSSMKLKFLGPYDTSGKYDMIQPTWQQNKERVQKHCSKHNSTSETIEPCTYAFMCNAMSGVFTVNDLRAKMKGVLTASDGWDASGNPIKQPRTGWYASKEGASFSLVVDVTLETKFLTIMSMKSYGPNFVDTEVEIYVQIKGKDNEASRPSSASYKITGFHDMKTSIHVPHKFELPGGGAHAGDSILLDAKLTSGSYFKIYGIAFCSN